MKTDLFKYPFNMIDVPWKLPVFKPLTPTRALQYLQKKPQYLVTWKQLIPNHFEAQEFCNLINQLRTKRIEVTEKINNEITIFKSKKHPTQQDIFRLKILKEQKKTIFPDIIKEVFGYLLSSRIKNTDITYREISQLIGSLANISKTKTEQIQDITEGINESLHEDLTHLEEYEYEILMTMDDLIHQFFTSKGIGNSLNEWEKKDFGQQAWTIFLANHKDDIEKGKIDSERLNTYLHTKKVI